MKRLEYSPDAAQKLRNIKRDVTVNYDADVAKRVVSNMTQTIRRLQRFEQSGISVEKAIGVPCDCLMVYTEHYLEYEQHLRRQKITGMKIRMIDVENYVKQSV